MSGPFRLDMMPLARAARLDGRDYLYGTIAFIRRARERILVTQFIVDADPRHDVDREVRHLCHLLAEARWRGVDVRVLLNSFQRDDGTWEWNWAAADFLSANGVPTRWFAAGEGSPRSTLHSKYTVFDGAIVTVGSHNWSSNAFRSSQESACAVDSPGLAMLLRSSFESAWGRASDDLGLL